MAHRLLNRGGVAFLARLGVVDYFYYLTSAVKRKSLFTPIGKNAESVFHVFSQRHVSSLMRYSNNLMQPTHFLDGCLA